MARELLDDPRWGAMPPSIVLATLLGSIYGLLGHAFVGQRWRQLPIYWLGGLGGFFGGYVLVSLGGGGLIRLGSVPLLEPSLGSCLVLAAIWWLIGRRPLPVGDANDE